MATAGRGKLRGGEIAVMTVTAILVIVLAVMLVQRAGGSGGSGTDQTPTATGTASDTAQETPTDGGGESAAGEDLSGTTFDFVAPSGNIGCAVSTERALCAIKSYDYADAIPAAEVEACDGTVGQFLQVTAEGAGLVCNTSTEELTIATEGVDVLEYGTEVTIDGFTCRSDTDGMSCRNDQSGYSFSVRRAGYTLS